MRLEVGLSVRQLGLRQCQLLAHLGHVLFQLLQIARALPIAGGDLVLQLLVPRQIRCTETLLKVTGKTSFLLKQSSKHLSKHLGTHPEILHATMVR